MSGTNGRAEENFGIFGPWERKITLFGTLG
jgi:hypothetical protein